jgi:hypothetical protein
VSLTVIPRDFLTERDGVDMDINPMSVFISKRRQIDGIALAQSPGFLKSSNPRGDALPRQTNRLANLVVLGMRGAANELHNFQVSLIHNVPFSPRDSPSSVAYSGCSSIFAARHALNLWF